MLPMQTNRTDTILLFFNDLEFILPLKTVDNTLR